MPFAGNKRCVLFEKCHDQLDQLDQLKKGNLVKLVKLVMQKFALFIFLHKILNTLETLLFNPSSPEMVPVTKDESDLSKLTVTKGKLAPSLV